MLTQERAQELLCYDRETGAFTFRKTRGGKRAGAAAGHVRPEDSHNGGGYVRIAIDGKLYYGHRVAWLMTTGEWPGEQIDHKDGNRANNAFANLRDVDRAANNQNIPVGRVDNACGYRGVYRNNQKCGFAARIVADGETFHLGTFATPELAAAAYIEAKERVHRGYVPERDREAA